jgi:hypothetical protein
MRQVMRAGAADAFSEPVRPTELMELLGELSSSPTDAGLRYGEAST